jgi:phospholipid/cholesterol/gamma-HCH transport system substrate-binding protein
MVLAQLAVFGAISVLVIGYAVFGLLKVHITGSPYSVKVELANAGGIFNGAEVAYRGVAVGRVSAVDLHTDGVTVTLAIDQGKAIPDNSIAHVYDLSAVGEQYVDLEPPANPSTTYLRNGSTIPQRRTSTPLETATVLYDLERFISSIDPGDVQILGREGALAFQGTGPELRSILANTTQIVDQLSSSADSTVRLLQNSAVLLHGAAAHAGAFDRFTASLKALSSTLAAKTPTIDALVRQSLPTTRLVQTLIADNGSAITTLLANLTSFSQIQVARVPGLRSLLVAVPEFGRLAPAVVHDGVLLGAADVNQDQPLCNTGVPLTSPISGRKSKIYAAQCGSSIVRGAANAPRPGSGASGSGASGSGASGASPSGASASDIPIGPSAAATGQGTEVGTYDPQSGLVSTSDGQLYRLGTNGGQTTLFGGNSWQALLLAGTGS